VAGEGDVAAQRQLDLAQLVAADLVAAPGYQRSSTLSR
jgi:hypothetical protein